MKTDELKKELLEFVEANNYFWLVNEENAKNVINIYVDTYRKGDLHITEIVKNQEKRELLLAYEKWSSKVHGFEHGNDLIMIDAFLKSQYKI